MKSVDLFGIVLPHITKFQLKERIRRLTSSSSKQILYFHYSEFLLRANRNPWYKDTLNRATISAIDGKGLHWAMWSMIKTGIIPLVFSKTIHTPIFIRIPIFLVLFVIQLIINIFSGFFSLVLKINYTDRTKNEVILGRDFIYDLLRIATEKNWKTLIIGGSRQSDEITKSFIHKLFPDLKLDLWTRDPKTLLMKDQVLPEYEHQVLNSENVCQFFPDLWEAKKHIISSKPDLILVCLGGASGRQEFFIDNLYQDKNVDFTLATGLGAAFDHLGGGDQQPIAPAWMIKSGLEWLYRLFTQPKRRKRIIDSIVTLWWWTTLYQFQQYGISRPTVVNIVHNHDKEILMVKRREILPGDVGWSFVQGGIENRENTKQAGLREVVEEAKLEPKLLTTYFEPILSQNEDYAVSLIRFILLGARYSRAKKYINFVEYSGNSLPKNNYENSEAAWFDHRHIISNLSIEKRPEWIKALEHIKSKTQK
jgi:exopolysaccharide biosynthesis WecB/TagA/CpsF family protein